MTNNTVFALEILFGALLVATQLEAGPLELANHPHQESMRAVQEAEHDVDHAWEVYHRAALGSTVASPRVQMEIEEHLHEARTLITQAQEAAAHGDKRQVEQMIKQVRLHTTQAIERSKEPKK
ncbi:MAG TPA: hypothetical protein VFU48_16255 [Nitrospira sp.]|nr:hypothetical protein [Nitrospira sp.]